MSGLLGSKVRAQSLVDVVVERMELAIFSGALAPGSRLSEQGLAASLGVSRGPLREAIRRLEGRKLLERIPNIGVRVAALSLKDRKEILEIGEVLEGMACALAAKNMTDAEIAALEETLDEDEKGAEGSKGSFAESKDYDFHVRIAAGSRNERLTQMLYGDLYYQLRVYRYASAVGPERARQALQEHKEIVAALSRRDAAAAERAMRLHHRNARRCVEEQLGLQAEGQGLLPPFPILLHDREGEKINGGA